MSSEKFIGINKFCESIKELTNGYCQIGIYFNDWIESKYYEGQCNIEPIGFTLTDSKGKVSYVRYYEIHEYLPEMKFIKFNENKYRKIPQRENFAEQIDSTVKTLYRLIVNVEETRSNNIVYHKSKIIKGNDKLTKKLLENLSEDRIRIVNEAAAVIYDDFDVYEEEPDRF